MYAVEGITRTMQKGAAIDSLFRNNIKVTNRIISPLNMTNIIKNKSGKIVLTWELPNFTKLGVPGLSLFFAIIKGT